MAGGGDRGRRRGRGVAMVFVGEVGGGDVLVAGQTLVLTAIVRADEVLLCVGGGHPRLRLGRRVLARRADLLGEGMTATSGEDASCSPAGAPAGLRGRPRWRWRGPPLFGVLAAWGGSSLRVSPLLRRVGLGVVVCGGTGSGRAGAEWRSGRRQLASVVACARADGD